MKKILYLLILIVSVTFRVGGQKSISFEYLGLSEGLSQISAISMLQDSLGRVWIGTRDGLNLYDGNNFRVFRSVPRDTSSLLGQNVLSLSQSEKHILIGTRLGLSLLNVETLKFDQYPFDEVKSVLAFRGKTMVGTSGGLFSLDKEMGKFERASEIFSVETSVNSLYKDHAGLLWICSSDGLYLYDSVYEEAAKVLSGNITAVFNDTRKRLWVGTDGQGVMLLDRQYNIVRTFSSNSGSENGNLVGDIVRDIDEDNSGNIWVGTFLGLSIIDGETFEVSNHQQNDEYPGKLLHNSIWSIMKDYQGTMWVGTYFGGVHCYNPEYQVFHRYAIMDAHGGGTGFRVIGNMLEDSENNLWIATEGGGLDYFNRKTGTFLHYTTHNGKGKSLSSNNVRALYLHNNETLFVGTHYGGLNKLDIPSGKIRHFRSEKNDSSAIQCNIVNEIIPFGSDYLLATHQGVIRFDPETEVFSHFIESEVERERVGPVIYTLFEDSFGKLWIGTEKRGVFCYDVKRGVIDNYAYSIDNKSSVSNNSISCIFEDHRFRLWVGTLGGGLNRYLREEDRFVNYLDKVGGFSGNFIYGIEESRFGNLWVATSKGLSRFDIDHEQFYYYHESNGFPLQELNQGALYLTSDGTVFVGGVHGLISFKEEDLLNNDIRFSLVFSSLYVNNSEVMPGDNTGILKKDLPFVEDITLKASQNVFTVHFSGCNYVPQHKALYQYKLEGFNEDWVEAGSRNFVTYTNLNPGDYLLKVRGVSGVEKNVIDEKVLRIHVLPPWYKTWYAILFYVLVFIALVLWVNYFYLSKARLADSLKAERQEKEKIKELNQIKLKFFTNISHEFRTPLTLITGILEAVLENTKPTARNYGRLLMVKHHALRLNNLITELLDFRKMEQGYIKLKVSENKLSDFLNNIREAFSEHAQHRQIRFDCRNCSYDGSIWFDVRQMEKVFFNLLSNAFKVVQDEVGKVSLEVIDQQGEVDIIVSDNGVGMTPEEAKYVFDRFYQTGSADLNTAKGTGIGLALTKMLVEEHGGRISIKSEKDKGTAFTISLKKGNRHFNAEELVPHKDIVPVDNAFLAEQPVPEEKMDEAPENAPLLLVVEDNEEVRRMLKSILGSQYRIIEAEDGNQGLKSAIDEQPDLIISDVMMPNLSGTEMCARLKRNIQTSHIPVILLTARTAIEYQIEGIETGADDYITKPFSVKLLKARVKNLLRNRAALQEKFRQDPAADIKELATTSIDQELVERAKAIVDAHIDDTDFDVNDFAAEMGLGRTRLYSKIKGITGQTPNNFILSIRLRTAADLLVNKSGLNVSEIAYATGFNTPRYFSRCFRDYFGVSPSNYIEKDDEV
ncbi:hybrid sensor histidine kinase/response regulator transcription factor [Marinilabilia salmonicolor]|uniref:histidine kinase n=1 Tax=Marinilabilia salmonicolor TaxID=989 RepID=A0A368V916_9BACT|nr:hybrid sensor histidine kinase/response regulator transcription factor [Marinilabilia salmonicolor]RCW37602.1 signal transduction histidine kinase [Marinilabilia salmonicolor]